MTSSKSALLLVGSPRGMNSSSRRLGEYLLEGLTKGGYTAEKLMLYPLIDREQEKAGLLESFAKADIIILSFPLYVDCLPSGVIKTLELLAEEQENHQSDWSQKKLVAISNSGFPEAQQSETALAICREFAQETGITWVGGLPVGMGGAINGKALVEAGGMLRNVVKALDLVVTSLNAGSGFPEESLRLTTKALFPAWLYVFFGNMSFKQLGKKNGLSKGDLFHRPFAE